MDVHVAHPNVTTGVYEMQFYELHFRQQFPQRLQKMALTAHYLPKKRVLKCSPK